MKNTVNVNGEEIFFTGEIKNKFFKTLVFVHGAGSTADEWGLLSKHLEGKFNTVMIDLAGHYRSKGKAKMSIEEQADFINNLILTLKEEFDLPNDFVYVGHSLGGAIGIEVATRNYDWLTKTILIATSPDFTNVSSKEFLNGLKNGHMDLDFYKKGFSPATPSVYYDVLVSKLSDVAIESVYADFYSTASFNDIDKLKTIKSETLIISANDDYIMPKNASKVLSENIKKSTWLKVADAGHFIVTEKPDVVAEMINKFVVK